MIQYPMIFFWKTEYGHQKNHVGLLKWASNGTIAFEKHPERKRIREGHLKLDLIENAIKNKKCKTNETIYPDV